MNTAIQTDGQVNVQKKSRRQGALGELAKAIRRSSVYFIIATIVLVAGFALLIYLHNALVEMGAQKSRANELSVKILEMRESEKDFEISNQPSFVIDYEKRFKEAEGIVGNMLSSSALSPQDNRTIQIVKSNLLFYKKTFDQADVAYSSRGRRASSGADLKLRQAGLAISAATKKIGKQSVETAILRIRGASKDYIILEKPKFIDVLNQRVDEARQQFQQDDSLLPSERNELIAGIDLYQEGFKEYSTATEQAKSAFYDAEIAAHATLYRLPALVKSLETEEENVLQQFFFVLIITPIILIVIFLLVTFQLRNAQKSADATLEATLQAQQRAEAENEALNDSVINILEAVNALSQRDLTVKAPVTEDVIGTVSDSINALSSETARVLSGVTGVAKQVSTVSRNVKNQANQVTQTAEQERQNVQQMVESLFEATQTMNQVAALAEQSNESAEEATNITNDALITVNGTVTGMENIRETISETEKRIKRLGERSQEISGIVNLINTISERTHALALNASMQAAVAGEAGRGFAVVAEEVQRLAESSRNATEQIATLVGNIQIETNETINTVNKTISQVVEGSEQAQKAGEQMNRTQEMTAQLVDRVRNIALASEQQKEMSANLLDAVQRIGESTELTEKQILAQNEQTDVLQKASANLIESISVFKLPDTDATAS